MVGGRGLVLGRPSCGYNPKATESFQEGVRFPPAKLFSAGRLNQDIVDLLAANSRVPTSNGGDLNAQRPGSRPAPLRRLAGRIWHRHGAEAFDAFAERAEALMRAAIRDLPDGLFLRGHARQ